MPDNLAGICPKDESGSIQRIVIKEWESFLYRSFDRDIMFRLPCLLYRKVHMELRSRCLTVLFLHMIPARRRRIVNFLKELFQLFKCDPVFRILRMVIVTVHHNDVGLQEVVDIAVVLLKLPAHMIKPDRLFQFVT